MLTLRSRKPFLVAATTVIGLAGCQTLLDFQDFGVLDGGSARGNQPDASIDDGQSGSPVADALSGAVSGSSGTNVVTGSGSTVSSGSPASTGSIGASGSLSGVPSTSGTVGSSGALATSGSSSGSGTSDAEAEADASVSPSSDSSSGMSSESAGTDPSSQYMPTSPEACPTIATGSITVQGEPVSIWAGTPTANQHGPIVFFWFATGANANEVIQQFGQSQIDAVTNQGGVVAAFARSTGNGVDVADAVWFAGDLALADEIVACSMQQLHTDPRHIHVMGAATGGIMAVWMAYARSGYVASVAPISGGLIGLSDAGGTPTNAPQDPTNVPAAMVIHGAEGQDKVGIDFAQQSAAYEADIAMKHGYSMDCNTGGGTASGPPQISPSIWQFFEDHPFKVKPEPYATQIPAGFPSYCQEGPRASDGGPP